MKNNIYILIGLCVHFCSLFISSYMALIAALRFSRNAHASLLVFITLHYCPLKISQMSYK